MFGWLDTRAPGRHLPGLAARARGRSLALALALASARFVWALARGDRGDRRAPGLVEAAGAHEAGFIWQGRYSLPLAVGVPIIAGVGVGSSETAARLGRRLALVLVASLAVAQILAFAQAIRRYAVGAHGPLWFFGHEQWSPPGTVARADRRVRARHRRGAVVDRARARPGWRRAASGRPSSRSASPPASARRRPRIDAGDGVTAPRVTPRIRVVVVDYNGGDLTHRLPRAPRGVRAPGRRARPRPGRQRVATTPWPSGCGRELPSVRVVESPVNRRLRRRLQPRHRRPRRRRPRRAGQQRRDACPRAGSGRCSRRSRPDPTVGAASPEDPARPPVPRLVVHLGADRPPRRGDRRDARGPDHRSPGRRRRRLARGPVPGAARGDPSSTRDGGELALDRRCRRAAPGAVGRPRRGCELRLDAPGPVAGHLRVRASSACGSRSAPSRRGTPCR